jgi:hypothetical protein
LHTAISYILWPFGIFCGHFDICIFPVLVFCTQENLATLVWCRWKKLLFASRMTEKEQILTQECLVFCCKYRSSERSVILPESNMPSVKLSKSKLSASNCRIAYYVCNVRKPILLGYRLTPAVDTCRVRIGSTFSIIF